MVWADGDGYRCQITPSATEDGQHTYNAVYAASGELYDLLRTQIPTLPEDIMDITDEKQAALINAICSPAPLVRDVPFANETPFGICTFVIAESPLTGTYVSTDFAAAVEELYEQLGLDVPEVFPRLKLNTIEFRATTVSVRDSTRKMTSNLKGLFGNQKKAKTEKRKLTATEIDNLSVDEIKNLTGVKFVPKADGTPNKATMDYLATIEVEMPA